MTGARYLVGDVFERLADLEDGSVDLILTSPPFLALRSYLPAGHPDKGREIGSEATPGAFIDRLLDLTEEWARVLAPHGSICIELGDTYAGGGGWGDYPDAKNPQRTNFDNVRGGKRHLVTGWPQPKSLCLIPELYRFALVYGFNPLTGRQTEGWRVRNVVRWCRPNPPVGALGDKVRPATSDLVIACKGQRRYFDLDAVRTKEYSPNTVWTKRDPRNYVMVNAANTSRADAGAKWHGMNPAGAPPLDHWWHDDIFDQDAWLIPTQPYRGAHYATWPEQLCVTPIEAMCPRRVCRSCGLPSLRITRQERDTTMRPGRSAADTAAKPGNGLVASHGETTYNTIGWTDCACLGYLDGATLTNKWRNGIVLDPFAGSGTTLAVAVGHGRDAIGIDLDPRNADLARDRCGMFLEIEGDENPTDYGPHNSTKNPKFRVGYKHGSVDHKDYGT